MSDTLPADLTSAANQALRRAQVQRLHRAHCLDLYTNAGTFAPPREADWRGHLWHALSLLNGETAHVRRAHAMLRYIADKGGSDFWSSAVAMILARFADKLDPDLRESLRHRLADFVRSVAKSRYNGYNDNFPSMAALTVLVGAELTGQQDLIPAGMQILESLRELLTRRGVLSEYTSPTYSAITLTCLAEIVNLSTHPDARAMALAAEHRVWTELASHLHPETSFLAGPHSRAYMVDMCAHPDNFHIVAYQVFGDAIFVNPTNAWFPPRKGQVLHGGGVPEFIQSHIGWQTTPEYHVPAYATTLAMAKRYPFVARASTEHGAFPRNWAKPERHPVTPTLEFAAGTSHLHTFMTKDFALGVASHPFLDSYQHTAFHLTYRRKAPACALEDVATFFARTILNDKPPHPDRHLPDEGRPLCLAHENTAMVLYHAKPAWTHTPPVEEPSETPVRSIKLSLVMPCMYGRPDAVWLGDTEAAAWSGQSRTPVPVFLHDGPVYIALHPLIGTDLGRNVAIRLEEANGFGLVSLYNYEGTPRRFAPIDLLTCSNGFVASVARAADWPSFEAFRLAHAAPEITDRYESNTGMREVRYRHGTLELAMKISPVSEGIKFRTVNGRLPEEPRFAATGFDPAQMPWW